MHKSYEDWSYMQAKPLNCIVLEAYRGQDIVGWYGGIERQLVDLELRYRNDKNDQDADRVHTFLHTWRNNQITGSLNRDTLVTLDAAASQLAVGKWKSSTYFGALRDQVRKIISSEEELPRMPSTDAEQRGTGGGVRRGGGGMAPPPSMFGGEETETPAGAAPETPNDVEIDKLAKKDAPAL